MGNQTKGAYFKMNQDKVNKPQFYWSLISITGLGFLLRLVNINNQPAYCDEGVHGIFSKYFINQGLLAYTHWHHPPLKYYFIWLSSQLFGNNFFAYRFPSIIFGTATIILIFLFAYELTRKLECAILASLFLAIDPFHLIFSRVAIEEASQGFWTLLSAFFFLLAIKKFRPLYLWLTAISVGLAITTKWQALPLIPALFSYFLIFKWQKDKSISFSDIITLCIFIGLIPLTIYGLAYFPWFEKGFFISEWFRFQYFMGISILSIKDYLVTANSQYAITWFLIPSYNILNYYPGPGNFSTLFVGFTNPFTWLLVFPSIIVLLKQVKDKFILSFPIVIFLFLYFPLIYTTRPVYPYSAAILAPWVAFFASFLILFLYEKPFFKKIVPVFLIASVVMSLLLFPFAAGIPTPPLLFKPITNFYSLFLIYL